MGCAALLLYHTVTLYFDLVIHFFVYTEQNYKRNTFVFAPIYHELN